MMLLLSTLTSGYTLRAAIRPASAERCVAARCDADRCYYGRVDEDGNVLKGVAEVSQWQPDRHLARPRRQPSPHRSYTPLHTTPCTMPSQVELGPTVRPSVSLSPSQVVTEQFKALSRGRVGQDRDGVSGIDAALAFVAPNIVEMRGTELNTRWLGGDGLWLPDTHGSHTLARPMVPQAAPGFAPATQPVSADAAPAAESLPGHTSTREAARLGCFESPNANLNPNPNPNPNASPM